MEEGIVRNNNCNNDDDYNPGGPGDPVLPQVFKSSGIVTHIICVFVIPHRFLIIRLVAITVSDTDICSIEITVTLLDAFPVGNGFIIQDRILGEPLFTSFLIII